MKLNYEVLTTSVNAIKEKKEELKTKTGLNPNSLVISSNLYLLIKAAGLVKNTNTARPLDECLFDMVITIRFDEPDYISLGYTI